jgi:hypothetical protein
MATSFPVMVATAYSAVVPWKLHGHGNGQESTW